MSAGNRIGPRRILDGLLIALLAYCAASLLHFSHHAIDLVPTILDVLGVEAPATIAGHQQSHFDGISMRYSFDSASLPSARQTQFY